MESTGGFQGNPMKDTKKEQVKAFLEFRDKVSRSPVQAKQWRGRMGGDQPGAGQEVERQNNYVTW